MDANDLLVRRSTYALFAQLGRAPDPTEVAAACRLSGAETLAAWRRLHDEHALVLDAGGAAIRMANPFSAVPTAHRVRAAGRWWYANCGWDAFGICAALGVDGDIESACPDCGELLELGVRGQRPVGASVVFHCLMPAADWWSDITFT